MRMIRDYDRIVDMFDRIDISRLSDDALQMYHELIHREYIDTTVELLNRGL